MDRRPEMTNKLLELEAGLYREHSEIIKRAPEDVLASSLRLISGNRCPMIIENLVNIQVPKDDTVTLAEFTGQYGYQYRLREKYLKLSKGPRFLSYILSRTESDTSQDGQEKPETYESEYVENGTSEDSKFEQMRSYLFPLDNFKDLVTELTERGLTPEIFTQQLRYQATPAPDFQI